jgi:hypothetical protein
VPANGTCLVHLVWAPLGPSPLASFLESYRRHPAGVTHQLLVVFNGFRAGTDLGPWRELLAGVEHEELALESRLLDLAAYRESAARVPAERYCFLNSYSVVLASGWLGHLERHVRSAGVGLVGVAGSLESLYTHAPFFLRRRRRDFPPFPNPHIRSNGFMLERELLLSLDWTGPRRKLDAWRLESGKRSITRQVLERGLQALVVGRDGAAYSPEHWRESATFRVGDQPNLLIADNRTRQWEGYSAAKRRRYAEMTWGDAS